MASAVPKRPLSDPPPPIAPPPSGPLPALPMARTRKSLIETSDAHQKIRPASSGSLSGIRPLTRAVTTSALPGPKPAKARSTPAVPTLSTTTTTTTTTTNTGSATSLPTPISSIPTPGKALRASASIGSFPSPPKPYARVNSLSPSPLSTSVTDMDVNSVKHNTPATKHRNSDVGTKKLKTRSSGYGLRTRQSTGAISTAGSSPSLLNGTGDSNLISSGAGARVSDSLLSVPSRPPSGVSSPNGSYTTDATQFEDGDEDAAGRGRPNSQEATSTSPKDSDKDTKGNVIVSVRVRPDATGGEAGKSDGEWMVDGRRSLISFNGREGGDYRYDNVFSPHDQNNRVYDAGAKRLVRRVMEGYHGTVFAYGMTGTGKTFSMQGTAHSPGVIPLAITDIFSYIRENPNREFLLRVSYLEIYNEKIHDLLSQSTPGVVEDQEIKLREDPKRGVYATPLKEEIVQSPNQLLRVIARGDLARRTAGTQYNARSSRSHAVVQIVVESRERTPARSSKTDVVLPGGVLVSTLSLIDLAGSERAAENKERRTEGAHINKSLLTLGTVIARLSGEDEKEKEKEEGAKPAEKDKEKLKHLPYRDSKLTRLLQPALSGDSLVSILCTIQLSSIGTSAATTGQHTGETLNTLKFASRAKNNIVSHAKRNESAPGGDAGSRALLDRYRLEIQDLRAQLEQQSKAKDEADKQDDLKEDLRLERELERQHKERHEEQMLEMQLARTALKERITHLNRLILSSRSLGVNSDSGRFSSMSVPVNRMSNASVNEFGRPVSMRSRRSSNGQESVDGGETGAAEDEPPLPEGQNRVSVGSITPGVMPVAPVSQMASDEDALEEDAEDAGGPDGTGEASLAQQNKMLQADLADKNRYIATLEKRLLQARRASKSRVSMTIASRFSQQEEANLNLDSEHESLVREKDREIEELKAKLDDQSRMVSALRNAARKRDMIDNRKSSMSEDTEGPTSTEATSNGLNSAGRRASSRFSNRSLRLQRPSSHISNGRISIASAAGNFPKTPLSPMALLSPSGSDKSDDATAAQRESKHGNKAFRRKSVDEMTMLLDQMIQDKVESGHVVRSDRGSLRVKRDTVMDRGLGDSFGAEDLIEEEE